MEKRLQQPRVDKRQEYNERRAQRIVPLPLPTKETSVGQVTPPHQRPLNSCIPSVVEAVAADLVVQNRATVGVPFIQRKLLPGLPGMLDGLFCEAASFLLSKG